MHGRLKIRSTEEQTRIRREEEQCKLQMYQAGVARVLSNRDPFEFNEEIFTLTAALLSKNPDIYTMWNVRKESLLYLKDNRDVEDLCQVLDKELKLTEQCLLANPKSYGSWFHRYWVMKMHPKADWNKELQLCTQYVLKDDRNFHCWDYRRLILSAVKVTKRTELSFATLCLEANFSNYSAWHYRSTLLDLDAQGVENELSLVRDAIFTDPADTSAWFYLNWVINNPAATEEALRKQLEAIDGLIDMEPDSKWALMMRWFLLKVLKIEANDQEGLICLEKLAKIDQLRKRRYEDLQKQITE